MRRRWIELVVAVVLVAAIGAAYYTVLSAYSKEAADRDSPYAITTSTEADRVDISGRLLSVDPIKEEAVFRLNLTPEGKYAINSTDAATEMKLFVDSSSGNLERVFPKGKALAPADVIVDMSGGQVTDYPFDHHTTELFMYMTATVPPPTGSPAGTAADSEVVPIDVTLLATLHGYRIDVGQGTVNDQGASDAVLTINRSGSTVVVVVFVMVMMLVLALCAASFAWRVVFHGLKPEIPMFTFLIGMIFAFPTVRNALPGTPPIGSLNDFISFFWAESTVVVSLVVLIAMWFWRSMKPPA